MSTMWRIEFKVIDHTSDLAAPVEVTLLEGLTKSDALNELFDGADGLYIDVLNVEESI